MELASFDSRFALAQDERSYRCSASTRERGPLILSEGPAKQVPSRRAEVEELTAHAPRYRVLIHNDDVTPMWFVVEVLRGVFALDRVRSERVMLEAHRTGVAHVATLPLEQAEFKVERTHALARSARYPLTLSYEPE